MYDQQVNTGCRQVAERIDSLFNELLCCSDGWTRPSKASIEANIFDTVTVWADTWEDEGDYEVAAGLRSLVLRRNLPLWDGWVASWQRASERFDYGGPRHMLTVEVYDDAFCSPQCGGAIEVNCFTSPTDALVCAATVISRRLAAIAEGVRNGKGR